VVQLTNFAAILAQAGTGGAGTLAATLALGNTTGGNDLEFSSGDGIVTTANGAGAGFGLSIAAGDAGGGVFVGGDLDLFAGSGSGGGADGTINLNGDVTVTGTLTLTNLRAGTGTPEGAEVADIGTTYSRTDGGAGNAVYFKMAGVGNTGWCPAGPHAVEFFTASGSPSFVTSRAVFDDPVTLGVVNMLVFWNGVLQREGATEDFTVVFGGASATVTLAVTPPSGDFITIQYLPE